MKNKLRVLINVLRGGKDVSRLDVQVAFKDMVLSLKFHDGVRKSTDVMQIVVSVFARTIGLGDRRGR